MNVIIAHAPQDLAQAEALAAVLRQRGFLAALETGERALLPLTPNDAVVGVISKDFVFSPFRLRLEKRLLDAWADGQLVLVKLDHAFAPVGLRDLPAIDASFDVQRDFTWMQVAEALRAMQAPPQAAPAPPAPDSMDVGASRSAASRIERSRPPRSSINYEVDDAIAPSAPAAPGSGPALKRAAPKKGGGGWLLLLALLVAGGGAAAYFLLGAGAGSPPAATVHGDQPANPTPPPDYVPPVEVGGVSFSQPILMATAIVVGLIILGFLAVGAARKGELERKMGKPDRKAPRAPAAAEAAKEEAPPIAAPSPEPTHAEPLVFISYARADQPRVDPLARAVKDSGHPIWIDTDEINAGTSWAGEIVRAIKAAGHVLIICSPRSFESDQVKREVYLADRYKKPLMPVFLEAAEPPEDFEYFFAGVQWLKLHEAPEAERPAILARALPAA